MHNLQNLSSDLILEIIQHLDIEEICFKVSTLSKMFYQLCKQPRLWRDICVKLELEVENPLRLSQRCSEDQTKHYQNLLKEFYSLTSWSRTFSSPSAAFSSDFSEFFTKPERGGEWVTALSKPLNQIEDPQLHYYAEFTVGGLCSIGVVSKLYQLASTSQIGDRGSCGYTFSGNVPFDGKWLQGKASYFASGDRISILVDTTDGTATFFRNGSQQHTHDISAWMQVRLHFGATVFSASTVKRHKPEEEKHRQHALQFNTNRKMGHKLL